MFAETWEKTPTITKALAIGTAALYTRARWQSNAPEKERQDASGSVLLFGLGATVLSAWFGQRREG